MINAISYWTLTLVMGPVTIFGLKPAGLTWVGILIFWVLQIITWCITFAMKGELDAATWYRKIWLKGAHDIAMMHVKRTRGDGNLNMFQHKTWMYVYTFWWAVSVKYIMGWSLWIVMWWRVQGDIADGGYSGFHALCQVMGLVYPGVGLLCMFIPACICTMPTKEDLAINFDKEERINSRKLGQSEEDFRKTKDVKTADV